MGVAHRVTVVLMGMLWAALAWAQMPVTNPNVLGNCGEPRADAVGCSVAACETCVCGIDAFCCGNEVAPISGAPRNRGGQDGVSFCTQPECWDDICVGEAANQCAAECVIGVHATPTLSGSGVAMSAMLLFGTGVFALLRRRVL